jgi:hypothetical protein
MPLHFVPAGHPDSAERCYMCASHGAVSSTISVEVSPGLFEYRYGMRPCPRCVRLGFVSGDTFYSYSAVS